jgi:RimJ/RimL family protein N-acetyltransferase/peptidase E
MCAMRLLLASRGIPGLAALLEARGPRAVLIPTASRDPAIAAEVERELTGAGLQVVRRQAGSRIDDADVIAVSGGNPYTLLQAMRGFELPDGVVYVGYSAGAIVTGPTLEPLRLTSPFTAPPGLDLTGLGLCDVLVLPHDNLPGRAERNAAAAAAYDFAQPLSDGELVLVEGDRVRVLGRPLIRTPRVVLREPNLRDVPQIVDGCSDPEVARFIPAIPVPYTERDAREWLASTDERALAITEDGGELLGAISLSGSSLGYWLRPTARGRGLASEALRAVADWSGRDDLYLTIHPDNTASRRVAERAGFVQVGHAGNELRFERR